MDVTNSGKAFQIPNPTVFNNLEDIINAITRLVVPVFLLTFAAMLLFGAFQYLTARDNAEQVSSARKIIIAAIIGFVLAVLAPTIVNFVAGLIGVQGLGLSGG
ncbi:MAG: hypothetical protein ABI721_04020 [Candidatus Dojkabacteria bacterium]